MAPRHDDFAAKSDQLDAEDPLAGFRDRFITPADADIVSYLDGNSLGRPLAVTAQRVQAFIAEQWAGRLIRGWTDEWMDWPHRVGDQLGRVALGAAAGQTVVADSTTVMLYKLARAAVDARPGRTEIVLDTDNFPTDRYVMEGIAAERGLALRWIESDTEAGITEEQVRAAVTDSTALAVFSHVAYRSGFMADASAITRAVHSCGALVLWDLSHSVGSVPVELDAWGADLAVGCTYKYLSGGPGSPAFGYVNARHHGALQQPIWGWLGRRDPFEMAAGYDPAPGMGSVLSGTPPILAMVPVIAGLELVEEVGMAAIRTKSLQLTDFVIELAQAWLVEHGARIASPREHRERGGHITLMRPGFKELTAALWEVGVIPDYRQPDGIRIGVSPLSTSFREVHDGLAALRELLAGGRAVNE
ncbi:MAG: kynureninase [Mycobacteriaceae bacterium]